MRKRCLTALGIAEKVPRPPSAQERQDLKSFGFTEDEINECVTTHAPIVVVYAGLGKVERL